VAWFDDHRLPYPYSPDGRIPMAQEGQVEPLVALAYVAACTSTLSLATGILILPQRNPLYTAQQIATLDVLSGGRLIVGIGVGWQVEEFEALQVPWPDRGARADEYVKVMQQLWSDDTSAFAGRFYRHEPLRVHPKPLQRPHPPIHVGGNSTPALRRVARLGRGWYAVALTPDQVAQRIAILDGFLAQEGRTRGEIEVTLGYRGTVDQLPDMIPKYAAAGVDRMLCSIDATTLGSAYASLERLAIRVGAELG
jgi:probable F420-dependent oxidoreductase